MADHSPTLSAPSAALPNEILSHIFVYSAQIFGTVHLPFQKRQIPIQIIISHVSSPWRHLALDTRELWTDVSIENLSKSTNERQVVYQTWLSRAGHRPVHLALDLVPYLRLIGHRTTSTETTDTFWKVVKRVHVRHLKLKILSSQLPQLVESPESTLHDLEQLDLDITIRELEEVSAMPQFISRARSVSFDNLRSPAYDFLPFVQSLALPWAQLTCLHVLHAAITFSQCMSLLLQTPLLEECYLKISFRVVDVEEEERLALPFIRTFMLDFGEVAEFIGKVIRHFEFPNLARLKLDSARYWPTKSYKVIKRYYNLCHIQDLQFFPHSIYPSTIATSTILKDAPLLRSLDVSAVSTIDEETIEGISSGELGHFPKILTIPCPGSEIEAVLNMVEARQKAVAQKIEHGYSWRDDELAGLKEVTIKVFWNGMSTRQRSAIEICRQRYKERLVGLERLGVRVEIL